MKPYQVIIRHHMPDAPKVQSPKVETPVIGPKEDPKRPIVSTGSVHLFRADRTDVDRFACGFAISVGMGTWTERDVTCSACKLRLRAAKAHDIDAEMVAEMLNRVARDRTPPMGTPVPPVRPKQITHGFPSGTYTRSKYACGSYVEMGSVSAFALAGITCKGCLDVLSPKVTHAIPPTFKTDDLRWACGESTKNPYSGGSALFSNVSCPKCMEVLTKPDSLMHWHSNPFSGSQAACGKVLGGGIRATWEVDKITCGDCDNKVFRPNMPNVKANP